MSFGILDILGTAATLAATATGGPLAGAATGAAISGGKTALQGGSPEQVLMSAGTSGAMSGIGAGVGQVGGMVGGEIAGEAGKEIGTMVAPRVMSAGIGAFQGKTPEQIAYEQAQSGLMGAAQYGATQMFAQGGSVTPALYGSNHGYFHGGRVGMEDGGGVGGGDVGGNMDGMGVGMDMGGGGWGDASTGTPGGYMDSGKDTGGFGNGADGGGGAGNGMYDSYQSYIPYVATPYVPEEPAAVVAPPRVAAPYVPAYQEAANSRPLVSAAGYASNKNFSNRYNPFQRAATGFAGGGRVGYADEGYVDFSSVDPETATAFQDAGYSAVPLPPPIPPPAPERDFLDRADDWYERNKKWAAPVGIVGGLTALGTLGSMLGGKQKTKAPKTSQQLQDEYPLRPWSGAAPVAAPVGYRPGISREWNYFPTRGYAKGGGIGSLPGGEGAAAMAGGAIMPRIAPSNDPDERAIHGRRVMDAAEAALSSNHPQPQDAISRFREHFGDDALATLMLKARRGDGMSDSLPATIDGRKEAALASGEFVLPADIVSGLGSGSSEAGARELELMMARVRKARTGSTKQPPGIKAGGYLPS